MKALARLALGFWACAGMVATAWAQVPPPAPPRTGQRPAAQRPATRPQTQNRTVYRPTQYQYGYPPSMYGSPDYPTHPGYRSILRQPPPYPASEYSYGFRNPGGIGRYEEFYPPGDVFQNGGRDPVPIAGFNRGIPGRSQQEQAMAVQTGVSRYGVMQQHLDNFARPLGFYGYGGFGFGPF